MSNIYKVYVGKIDHTVEVDLDKLNDETKLDRMKLGIRQSIKNVVAPQSMTGEDAIKKVDEFVERLHNNALGTRADGDAEIAKECRNIVAKRLVETSAKSDDRWTITKAYNAVGSNWQSFLAGRMKAKGATKKAIAEAVETVEDTARRNIESAKGLDIDF